MAWMIAAAAKFDAATEESIRWCMEAVIKIIAKMPVVELFDAKAVKSEVEKMLATIPKATWFMHYDHGSDYVMWGDDEQPIIDLDNLDKLAGMHVYTMNCSSGKGLGAHAISKGILEYWGYMDTVSFTNDAVNEFGEAFNYGIIAAITQDKFLKDVVEETRQHGYDIAEKLTADGKILAASCLVNDMNILHCFWEGGPPPPDPECRWSRLALRLFGWNGLWFFRNFRQKVFPDMHPSQT